MGEGSRQGAKAAKTCAKEAICKSRHELRSRAVPFERQVVVPVLYKGLEVGEGRINLLVGSLVVLELKALPALDRIHTAQLLSYLKTTMRAARPLDLVVLALAAGCGPLARGLHRLLRPRPLPKQAP
jgi:hypothetical protein